MGVVYVRKLLPIIPTRPLQHIVRKVAVSNRRILIHIHLFDPLSQQVFYGPDIPWGYHGILSEVIVNKEPEFWLGWSWFCSSHSECSSIQGKHLLLESRLPWGHCDAADA